MGLQSQRNHSSYQSDHLLNTDFLQIDTESTAKTLGERWNASSGEFFFVPPDLLHKKPDPFPNSQLLEAAGWLAPFVVCQNLYARDLVAGSRF